eukprot:4109954-Pyramimonas_sp.AAC.1
MCGHFGCDKYSNACCSICGGSYLNHGDAGKTKVSNTTQLANDLAELAKKYPQMAGLLGQVGQRAAVESVAPPPPPPSDNDLEKQ